MTSLVPYLCRRFLLRISTAFPPLHLYHPLSSIPVRPPSLRISSSHLRIFIHYTGEPEPVSAVMAHFFSLKINECIEGRVLG